jgi:hypothetical protein
LEWALNRKKQFHEPKIGPFIKQTWLLLDNGSEIAYVFVKVIRRLAICQKSYHLIQMSKSKINIGFACVAPAPCPVKQAAVIAEEATIPSRTWARDDAFLYRFAAHPLAVRVSVERMIRPAAKDPNSTKTFPAFAY